MCSFKNGKPYKEYMQIYSDGNYDISYLNENGKLEGLYTRYNKANQLLCAYTYVNGVLTGPAKIIENGKYVYKVYYLGEEANLYQMVLFYLLDLYRYFHYYILIWLSQHIYHL